MAAAYSFPVKFARRVPDPVFQDRGIERHFFFVRVRDVPRGLPLDPNARVPNIKRSVYREIQESLLAPDGQFHLKHKGITVVASSVEQDSKTAYLVHLNDGEGILDGGHTYTLIIQEQEGDKLPDNQFVKFEIVTRAPREWIPAMAGGLNTSVQVQDMSLDNLAGSFDWLKTLLENESYISAIAWRENEDCELDARDVVSILTCFNIDLFPNDVDETQPVIAYEKKSAALKLYEDSPGSYEKLGPIVKDILVLHDLIRADAKRYWNEEGGGKFGSLAFVEKKRKGFELPFTQSKAESRLTNGALYPILAAFRWMVEHDTKNGKFKWRGGFRAVRSLWEESAVELLKMTKQASDELGRNPNAVGKSRNHWSNVFARVAKRDLEKRMRK